MATAEEISTRALKRLGVFGAGESPSSADVSDAVEALNAMIASWEADWLSGDILPLDSRFEQGVVAMLAVRLAEDFGKAPGPVLARDAERGEQQLYGAFFTVPQSRFEGALRSSGTNSTFALIGSEPFSYDAWQADTAYSVRMYVSNLGHLYECTTAGTSASSGGPTGTTSDITDGTAVWVWRKAIGDY